MLKVDLSTAAMCATFVRGLGPALAQPAGLQIEGGIFTLGRYGQSKGLDVVLHAIWDPSHFL